MPAIFTTTTSAGEYFTDSEVGDTVIVAKPVDTSINLPPPDRVVSEEVNTNTNRNRLLIGTQISDYTDLNDNWDANIVATSIYTDEGVKPKTEVRGLLVVQEIVGSSGHITLTQPNQPNIRNIGELIDLDVNGPTHLKSNVFVG